MPPENYCIHKWPFQQAVLAASQESKHHETSLKQEEGQHATFQVTNRHGSFLGKAGRLWKKQIFLRATIGSVEMEGKKWREKKKKTL